ncbi:MAG: hydrolase TatD, partial [Oscillospiraceae bacterium]|nr:hydrolase TatD [Oscillospiraceae bacterium]
MIGIFDSHAHYNDPQFAHDYDEVIQYIHENGVCGAINIGYDIDTSKKAQALSKKYPFL